MNEITIDKDIPIPQNITSRQGRTKYPFRIMEVGDSFLIPCDKKDRKRVTSTISSTIARFKLELKHEYTRACVDGGVRIWRVK